MRLSTKTFLTITVTVALGLTGIFGVAGVVLVDSFKEFETDQIDSDLDRVAGLVQDDLRSMEISVRGLTDLAVVLLGNNQTADANVTQIFLNLFTNQEIDHVFIETATANGTLSFGFSIDREAFNFTAAPEDLNATLNQMSFGSGLLPTQTASGILSTNGTVYLLATTPLTFQFGNGTTQASSLTIARTIDPVYAQALAAKAKEDIKLLAPDGHTGTSIERPTWDRLIAYRSLTGVEGQPGATLQLESEREAFQEGLATIQFFFFASLGVAAVFLFAGLILMQVLVTGRVKALDQRMEEIRASDRLDGRVEMGGSDEVQELGETFNELMQTLEDHEETLQRTNRDLEGFASIASHDLKSPLSSFSLNLSLERRAAEKRDDEAALRRIERMERGVKSMSDRIDAILAYSRSKSQDIHIGPVDLQDVLDQVLEDVAGEIERTGARIDATSMPVAIGDEPQLLQVFQNLISNAMKYAKEDEAPRIRVRAETRPGACRIHFEDQGRGFASEDVEAMLEPFRRLSNAEGQSGHGIGLATVDRIIQRLNGSLDVHGEPGVGARFTVTLPAP